MNDLVFRLRKRAEIRRQIYTRKSVQEGKPDRIADLLEEAAKRIDDLEQALCNHPPLAKCAPGAHGPEPMEPCDVCSWSSYVRELFPVNDCKHEWLLIPGGDISVKRYNERFPDRKLPEDPEDRPYTVFVSGYWVCTLCHMKGNSSTSRSPL